MVTHLTKQNFKEIVEESSKPVIIDIFAVWCGPCHNMMPIYEDIANELKDKYTFAKLNVDEFREQAIQYGVSSVPTIIFIKNNKIVGKETGFMAKDAFKARINEYFK